MDTEVIFFRLVNFQYHISYLKMFIHVITEALLFKVFSLPLSEVC